VGRGVRGWSTGWEALLNRVLGEVVFTYLHRWQLCVRKSTGGSSVFVRELSVGQGGNYLHCTERGGKEIMV